MKLFRLILTSCFLVAVALNTGCGDSGPKLAPGEKQPAPQEGE